MERRPASDCIHCHVCRDNCGFLDKYGIDIGDTDRLRELAYHCFLCGRCTEVCPIGIDGREVISGFRREAAEIPGSEERKRIEKQYRGLLAEKRNYRYRNWKHVTEGRIFFPGCNFPSLFPATCRRVEALMAEHGIGTVYECCGKPVAELGFRDDEERILGEISSKLNDAGVTEIITACPNCLSFFGSRLGVMVRSIYSALDELGIGSMIDGDVCFYLPCPDRTRKAWVDDIRPFISGRISFMDGPQCCGLGGSAASLEPDIAKGFIEDMRSPAHGAAHEDMAGQGMRPAGSADGARLCTYCASCMGQFGRGGFTDIEHVLTIILGTGEKADTGKSYVNRVLTRFR